MAKRRRVVFEKSHLHLGFWRHPRGMMSFPKNPSLEMREESNCCNISVRSVLSRRRECNSSRAWGFKPLSVIWFSPSLVQVFGCGRSPEGTSFVWESCTKHFVPECPGKGMSLEEVFGDRHFRWQSALFSFAVDFALVRQLQCMFPCLTALRRLFSVVACCQSFSISQYSKISFGEF